MTLMREMRLPDVCDALKESRGRCIVKDSFGRYYFTPDREYYRYLGESLDWTSTAFTTKICSWELYRNTSEKNYGPISELERKELLLRICVK